jgi:hypothetical protein
MASDYEWDDVRLVALLHGRSTSKKLLVGYDHDQLSWVSQMRGAACYGGTAAAGLDGDFLDAGNLSSDGSKNDLPDFYGRGSEEATEWMKDEAEATVFSSETRSESLRSSSSFTPGPQQLHHSPRSTTGDHSLLFNDFVPCKKVAGVNVGSPKLSHTRDPRGKLSSGRLDKGAATRTSINMGKQPGLFAEVAAEGEGEGSGPTAQPVPPVVCTAYCGRFKRTLACRIAGCTGMCDKAYTARSRVCLKHMQARTLTFTWCPLKYPSHDDSKARHFCLVDENNDSLCGGLVHWWIVFSSKLFELKG